MSYLPREADDKGSRVRVLVALFAVAALLGCRRNPAPQASGNTKVKLQLNWVAEPEFGGFYAARDGGAFAKQGLEVDIVAGAAGTPVLQIVASGQAEFGTVGGDDVVLARARGVDVVAIFATFQHSPLGVMVHGARGIDKLDDLKSGTLALEPGLPFGQWLKKKYGFAGVTLVPYDGGVAKFLTDPQYAQQCYVTSEPIAARHKGASPRVFSAQETGFDPYTNVIVTRTSTLRSNAPLVRKLVTAVVEGWRSYLADPKAANATMHGLNTAMDAETFAEAAKTQEPLVRGELANGAVGTMTEARWATLAAQLEALGTVTHAPPARECFSNDGFAP